jgi:hypothetical protein
MRRMITYIGTKSGPARRSAASSPLFLALSPPSFTCVASPAYSSACRRHRGTCTLRTIAARIDSRHDRMSPPKRSVPGPPREYREILASRRTFIPRDGL